MLVFQGLGSAPLPQIVLLAKVCAESFMQGKVFSSDTASAEAACEFLPLTNRPWLEEGQRVLGLCTAGAISRINYKSWRWIKVIFALILWCSTQAQLS